MGPSGSRPCARRGGQRSTGGEARQGFWPGTSCDLWCDLGAAAARPYAASRQRVVRAEVRHGGDCNEPCGCACSRAVLPARASHQQGAGFLVAGHIFRHTSTDAKEQWWHSAPLFWGRRPWVVSASGTGRRLPPYAHAGGPNYHFWLAPCSPDHFEPASSGAEHSSSCSCAELRARAARVSRVREPAIEVHPGSGLAFALHSACAFCARG